MIFPLVVSKDISGKLEPILNLDMFSLDCFIMYFQKMVKGVSYFTDEEVSKFDLHFEKELYL